MYNGVAKKDKKKPQEVANRIFPFMNWISSNGKDRKSFYELLNVNLVFSENPFFSDSFDFFLLRKHFARPTQPPCKQT